MLYIMYSKNVYIPIMIGNAKNQRKKLNSNLQHTKHSRKTPQSAVSHALHTHTHTIT